MGVSLDIGMENILGGWMSVSRGPGHSECEHSMRFTKVKPDMRLFIWNFS